MSDIENLGLFLGMAVPLRVAELRAHPIPESEMMERAQKAAQMIGEHGDSLMFRDKYTAAAASAMVDGIACAITMGHEVPGPLGKYLPAHLRVERKDHD